MGMANPLVRGVPYPFNSKQALTVCWLLGFDQVVGDLLGLPCNLILPFVGCMMLKCAFTVDRGVAFAIPICDLISWLTIRNARCAVRQHIVRLSWAQQVTKDTCGEVLQDHLCGSNLCGGLVAVFSVVNAREYSCNQIGTGNLDVVPAEDV